MQIENGRQWSTLLILLGKEQIRLKTAGALPQLLVFCLCRQLQAIQKVEDLKNTLMPVHNLCSGKYIPYPYPLFIMIDKIGFKEEYRQAYDKEEEPA